MTTTAVICPFDAAVDTSSKGCKRTNPFGTNTFKYPGCLTYQCAGSCSIYSHPGCKSGGTDIDCDNKARWAEYIATAGTNCGGSKGAMTALECRQGVSGSVSDIVVKLPVVVPDPPRDYPTLCQEMCGAAIPGAPATQYFSGCVAHSCIGNTLKDPALQKYNTFGVDCGYSIMCIDNLSSFGDGCERIDGGSKEAEFAEMAFRVGFCSASTGINFQQCYKNTGTPAKPGAWILSVPANHTKPVVPPHTPSFCNLTADPTCNDAASSSGGGGNDAGSDLSAATSATFGVVALGLVVMNLLGLRS